MIVLLHVIVLLQVIVQLTLSNNSTWWQRGRNSAMAQIHLQPPDPFDFMCPDDWPHWKRRFEQFRSAAGLQDDSAAKQVNTLLYCLGEEAESVLISTNITEEERKDYSKVIEKFDSFFKVRRNVIFERTRFNRRSQLPGEPVEQYIVELYNLAEHCNYGDLKSEMIRDRLVVGIQDLALSERLQLDPELTLEKAKTLVRQREAVKEQQQVLKGTGSSNLDEMQQSYSKRQPESRRGPQYYNQWNTKNKTPDPKPCIRCGRGRHPREKCPAKDVTCHRCQKRGHYGSCCRTKLDELSTSEECSTCGRDMDTISESNQEGQTIDSAFLDAVGDTMDTCWTATVTLNGKDVIFKLDTGAEVTAITEETYQMLNAELTPPCKKLYGPSQVPLLVKGHFQEQFTYQGKQTIQSVYVINTLKRNLLGLPTITALNLAVRVEAIMQCTNCAVADKFPSIFQGLGNFGESYTIRLKPGEKPHAIYTPRHVAMPLRSKVKQELDRIESMNVQSRRAYSLVCWYGGCAKKDWDHQNMCRPQAIE